MLTSTHTRRARPCATLCLQCWTLMGIKPALSRGALPSHCSRALIGCLWGRGGGHPPGDTACALADRLWSVMLLSWTCTQQSAHLCGHTHAPETLNPCHEMTTTPDLIDFLEPYFTTGDAEKLLIKTIISIACKYEYEHIETTP